MYTLEEAKRAVIEAGHILLETGLIARTWGNVSARISETQFVITPSGKAYETLTPDDIVVVNIADCGYEGDVKPSSEKGIHADAYALRKDVSFVIHTHQVNASIVAAAGLPIDPVPKACREILGETVPCAGYGMPSTDKLRNAVKTEYENNPQCKAFLMAHHGAVCLGSDFDETFEIIKSLEKACEIKLEKAYKVYEGTAEYTKASMLNSYIRHTGGDRLPDYVSDFGSSVRDGDYFLLAFKSGANFTVRIKDCVCDEDVKLPAVAKIHAAIYKSSNVNYIRHLAESDIIAYSLTSESIDPRLDDFAQIAGARIGSFKWDGSAACASGAARKIKGKNAVLISGAGALCTGATSGDVDAAELVMSKECKTQIGSLFLGSGEPLGFADRVIQRAVYVNKYSKKANEEN